MSINLFDNICKKSKLEQKGKKKCFFREKVWWYQKMCVSLHTEHIRR